MALIHTLLFDRSTECVGPLARMNYQYEPEPIISVFCAIDANPGDMYFTAALELNVAIVAVTHAPPR